MNLKTKQKGFTLVELLIVIVVIAILAAISIVAYNGIQNRAKTTSAAGSAATVVKKAEAANAIKSAYPSAATGTGSFVEQSDSDLAGSGIKLVTPSAITKDAKTFEVSYEVCTAVASGSVPNIARVDYWNYGKNAKQSAVAAADGGGYLYLGGTSSTACSTWTPVTGGPY